jgi:DNA-binding protein HU-beta
MNRSQMIDELARRSGLSKGKAGEVVHALFDPIDGLISTQLQAGGKVAFHDFGAFDVKETPARKGHDPRTGKEIDIPARRSCTFKARKGLRSSMKDIVGA